MIMRFGNCNISIRVSIQYDSSTNLRFNLVTESWIGKNLRLKLLGAYSPIISYIDLLSIDHHIFLTEHTHQVFFGIDVDVFTIIMCVSSLTPMMTVIFMRSGALTRASETAAHHFV